MSAPYGIILADPPWDYRDKAKAGARGAGHKYRLTATDILCRLDVRSIAARSCALFMWATSPMLPDAFRVMEAWGFRYSTVPFCWVKTRSTHAAQKRVAEIVRVDADLAPNRARGVARTLAVNDTLLPSLHWGMGASTRANVEHVLLGVRGKLGRVDAGVHQVVMSPLRSHSQKPPEVRDRIVRLLGDRPRIELFARDRAEGWDAWGDQVPGGSDVYLDLRPDAAATCASAERPEDERQSTIFDLLGAVPA